MTGLSDDFASLVRTHGWAIRHVLGGPSGPPFSYTAGLTTNGWAELVVVGLPVEVAQAFLWNAVNEQRLHGAFHHGDRTGALTDGGDVVFLSVRDTSVMTATRDLITVFDALQLVWSDSGGNFPWDPEWRNGSDAQPLLGPSPPA